VEDYAMENMAKHVACPMCGKTAEEAHANGELMAAAPALLETCEAAQEYMAYLRQYLHLPALLDDDMFERYKAMESQLRARIAAAKGGEE
jgi:hypothetical protein